MGWKLSVSPNRPAVFLDRDGVINRDSPSYVKSWAEFEFLPGSLEAIAALTRAGLAVIVVTNQSGVGRGLMGEADLADIHRRMAAAVEAAGGRIAAIYHCPHLPDAGCACRKPSPAMVEEAARTHHLDLTSSFFVGDREKDIRCARAAGCGRALLVRSGSTPPSESALSEGGAAPDFIADDLKAAAAWILDRLRGLP